MCIPTELTDAPLAAIPIAPIAEALPGKLAEDQYEIALRVADLRMDEIKKVYSGKRGRCCCGCSGRYHYTVPGYADLTRPESHIKPNEAVVRRIRKTMLAHPESIVFDGVRVPHYYVETDTRLYILYLRKGRP